MVLVKFLPVRAREVHKVPFCFVALGPAKRTQCYICLHFHSPNCKIEVVLNYYIRDIMIDTAFGYY